MAQIRLGILDAVPPEFNLPGEKTDPQKFIDMFEDVSAPMSFTVYDAATGDFPAELDECDAYLITGSPCSVYDTYTWIPVMEDFIREAFNTYKPLVGICFGHQLIAQSLGGKVRLADNGWLLGLHEVRVRIEKAWMDGEAATHPLYFINQDQVVDLPPGIEHLAHSADCPHAMLGLEHRLLTMQAHPEQSHASMLAFAGLLLEDYHLDRTLIDDAIQSMAQEPADAERLARWISNFLLAAAESEF